MKAFLPILILLFSSNLIAQDSTETERIYREYGDGIFYESVEEFPFSIVMDSSTMEPINGWLIKDYLKTIWVEHYKDGKQIGYYLKYDLIKSKYHLTKAGFTIESKYLNYVQSWTFNPKNQFIDSNSYSYGLVQVRIFDPEPENKKLSIRDIDFRKQPFKVKDYYYFRESKKAKYVKYKVESARTLWTRNLLDSIQKTFPFVLNENKNPFTLLRFDGIYTLHTHQGEEKYRCSRFIKFYPNGTVKFAFIEGVINKFNDWDKIEPSKFQLRGNTINFNISGTELSFTDGEFYPIFLMITSKLYDGLNRTMIWSFELQE